MKKHAVPAGVFSLTMNQMVRLFSRKVKNFQSVYYGFHTDDFRTDLELTGVKGKENLVKRATSFDKKTEEFISSQVQKKNKRAKRIRANTGHDHNK